MTGGSFSGFGECVINTNEHTSGGGVVGFDCVSHNTNKHRSMALCKRCCGIFLCAVSGGRLSVAGMSSAQGLRGVGGCRSADGSGSGSPIRG
jgi:hypothetical protein